MTSGSRAFRPLPRLFPDPEAVAPEVGDTSPMPGSAVPSSALPVPDLSLPPAPADAAAVEQLSRKLALTVLVAMVLSLAWGVREVYQAITDAWIVPLHRLADDEVGNLPRPEDAAELAFVPYEELASAPVGARVVDCAWGLVGCRPVGWVREILPVEVSAEGPWGNRSLGRYAVIALDDSAARLGRVLRVA